MKLLSKWLRGLASCELVLSGPVDPERGACGYGYVRSPTPATRAPSNSFTRPDLNNYLFEFVFAIRLDFFKKLMVSVNHKGMFQSVPKSGVVIFFFYT